MEFSNELAVAIVEGESTKAVEIALGMMQGGTSVEVVIEGGLTLALRSLDMKCTADEFDLLEILLAGRAVMSVMNALQNHGYLDLNQGPQGTLVLGTIQGDIHDLGKNIVRIIFSAAGFRVIDLGVDVPPEKFVIAAKEEQADWIGVSGLTFSTLAPVRQLKPIVLNYGLEGVQVIAGGGALKQCSPEDLNVDLVVRDVFSALRICTGEGE